MSRPRFLVIVALGVVVGLAVLVRITRDEQSGLDPLLRVGIPLAAAGAGVLLLSAMLARITREARARITQLRAIAPHSDLFTVAGVPELEALVAAFADPDHEQEWPKLPTLEVAEAGVSVWGDGARAEPHRLAHVPWEAIGGTAAAEFSESGIRHRAIEVQTIRGPMLIVVARAHWGGFSAGRRGLARVSDAIRAHRPRGVGVGPSGERQ